MLSSKSLGRYCWDFRAPTFRILDELTGRFWGLDFCFSLGAWEEALWRGKKGSTVGRLCDLLWVALTTYRRFFRRPTVGLFLGVLEVALKEAGKWGGRTQGKGAFVGGERGGWFLCGFSPFWSVSERGGISGGLGVCVGGLVDFLYECVWGGGLWISGALARGSLRWRQGPMPLGASGRFREWSVLSGRRETGCLELLLRAPRCSFC